MKPNDHEAERRALPLEEGVCGPKHSVDDVEVSTPKARHHFSQEVGPFLGEVFPSYDTDGIAQLWEHTQQTEVGRLIMQTHMEKMRLYLFLDLLWTGEH